MWFSAAIERTAAKARGRERGNHELSGIKVYVEYPKGSTREKTGPDGKKWSRKMATDYGRIVGTRGKDGDAVDVFVGEHEDSERAFVLDQPKKGDPAVLDEHKVLLGFRTESAAKAAYLSNYPKDWVCGEITAMTIPVLKRWLKEGDMKERASEYGEGERR